MTETTQTPPDPVPPESADSEQSSPAAEPEPAAPVAEAPPETVGRTDPGTAFLARIGLVLGLVLLPMLAWEGWRRDDSWQVVGAVAGLVACLAFLVRWTRFTPLARILPDDSAEMELVAKFGTVVGLVVVPLALRDREWLAVLGGAGILVASQGVWLRWAWVVWLWYGLLAWALGVHLADVFGGGVHRVLDRGLGILMLLIVAAVVVRWHRGRSARTGTA